MWELIQIIIIIIFFLIFSYRFPPPPPEPTGYRKHLKKYKAQQTKKEEFLDMLQPHIRQLIAEVNMDNISCTISKKLYIYMYKYKNYLKVVLIMIILFIYILKYFI